MAFLTSDETPVLFPDGSKEPAQGVRLKPGWTYRNVVKATDAQALHDALMDVRTALRDGTAPVLASGSTTRRTLGEHLRGLKISWEDATFPLIIGHRGTTVGAPENTVAAFDAAAALGVPIETDVQRTTDGQLVLMHDGTTTRTTLQTATVAQQPYVQLATLDAAAYRPGPNNCFAPQRIPTFEDYLRRYGNRCLLLPEVKDTTDATATAMAELVVQYGLQEAVAVQSFTQSNLTAVKAVDSRIRTVLTSSAQVTPAAAVAAGVFAVYIDATNVTAQYVTDMHAVGVKVFVYNTGNIIKTGDTLWGYGVDGLTAEDTAYFRNLVAGRTATGTSVVGVPVTWWEGGGWNAFGSVSNTPEVSGGYVTFSGVTLTGSNFFRINLPVRTADTPATQTFTTTLQAVQTNADTSRWMGVRFGWNTDNDVEYNGAPANGRTPSGYLFAYRRSGAAELSRVVNGVVTSIGTATWDTYTTAAEIPLRVETTSTGITVTRTDTGQTLAVTDATLARGGLLSVVGSGVVPGVGATTVTY